MNKILFIFFIFIVSFSTTLQNAKETLIYADSITYDKDKNLIAKGNVKIISNKDIIRSELVIVKDIENKIILPTEFQYRDDNNNYYFGTSGEFSNDFKTANIKDIKLLLNDGSRIVGKESFKTGKIDLINKGAYTPCYSKIRVGNFICPIWQYEGEKILHDGDNLFLHQKHAKLRFINLPVFYFPYIVSPSPLRKKRKSGFLTPRLNFTFFKTKVEQSASFPYYFAIDEDKELLLTPTLNYGGGVDASQRIVSRYNQLTSGGNIYMNLSTETNLENDNNESWARDASLIGNINHRINQKFKISLNTAFQTSPTYLRRTDQNNLLNRKNTLDTAVNLDGYNLNKIDDHLNVNISGYQVVKNNEDNKKTPTTFPYIKYTAGTYKLGKTNYSQKISFYNIFRDKSTADHAQRQQKLYHNLSTDYEFYNFKSKLNFKTELLTQYYNINNKQIKYAESDFSGSYARIFPMSGFYIETPIVNPKRSIQINPKASFIFNGSQSSSEKISNEESTNNVYSLLNNNNLNRYTGTDKLDNSKRVNYGFDFIKDLFKVELSQSYEFDLNSNYNHDVGLKDHLSDLLGLTSYKGEKHNFGHSFRLDPDIGKFKSQSISYSNNSFLGNASIVYSESRKETNNILRRESETLDLNFGSNKILNYSTINMASTFDLIKEDPTKYTFAYEYFDECFGINLDFTRNFYADRDLKPNDTLTILFSFKHLGTYKSTNLAVSETDKQDIRWEAGQIDNRLFN